MGNTALKWIIRHRTPVRILLDIIAHQVAFWVTFYFRCSSGFFPDLPPLPKRISFSDSFEISTFWVLDIVLLLYWLILFALRGYYRRKDDTGRFDVVVETFKNVATGIVLIFIFSMEPTRLITPTRIVLFLYGTVLFLSISLGRILYRNFIRACYRRDIGLYPSILIGFGKRGKKLYETLTSVKEFGYKVVAVMPFDPEEKVPEHLGVIDSNSLDKALDSQEYSEVEYVLLSLEPSQRDHVLKIIDRLSRFPVRLMIIPDFYQVLVGLAKSHQIHGVPLLELFPELITPFSRIVKRLVDIGVSSLLLLVSSPFLLIIAIAIKFDSKGPVLYKQTRVGYKGKEFTLFKFRTMKHDAEADTGAVWAEENDPRITRVGRFLRKTRIDELPQTWNVLIGNMSLVGPRPERKVFVNRFSREIPFYSRRLNMKPGITGWAQIRRGYDTDLDGVKEKLQYDLFYLENYSLSLDIKILAQTLWVMFKAGGR